MTSTNKKLERDYLLFTRTESDRKRGNYINLKEKKFKLDLSKKTFSQRAVKHWNRLPREVVSDQSLEGFKARLNWALSNLV